MDPNNPQNLPPQPAMPPVPPVMPQYPQVPVPVSPPAQPFPPQPQQPTGQVMPPAAAQVAPTPPQPAPTIAYDQNGQPVNVYASPPQQFVHLSRAVQPMQEEVPPEVKRRHDESLKRYPSLNLSASEYVLSAVRRHPIGLLRIWFIAFMIILAFAVLLGAALANQSTPTLFTASDGTLSIIGAALLAVVAVLVIGGAFVATYVYNANRFFLTNESVIQEIQTSLFSKHEQTVSLSNIEDASYKKGGIIASWLDYGTIRLSTEGDETTYRFNYVSNPKKEIAVLNNAVEAFKNGRPVDPPNDDQPS